MVGTFFVAGAIVVLAALVGGYAWERGHRRTQAMTGGLRADITLPHEQEFELYHNAFSLCSKKVRVCLAELDIAYVGRHVDLIETGSYETLGREFLAVNPEGVVPVLVHDGHPVYQSHDQIHYAAEHAPAGAPALLPEDPALHDEMQRWVDCASIIGDDPIETTRVSAAACSAGLTLPLFAAMITDIPTWRILEGLAFHRLKIRPVLFLALKTTGIRRIGLLSPVLGVVRTSRRHMHSHLDALEEQLAKSGGPWILGEQLTLADVSWMVILERLLEQDAAHLFLGDDRRPGVTAYWQRLQARPSYRDGIAAHRHQSVVRGTERLRAAKASDPALRRLLEGSGEATRAERVPR
ncbi:MAG: glutathione S-transferase family protein [Myxococcales bacterium]|jgi:glutathione S-transferase|nr:MAG: glutathione S-transferase family protein [Myxococcales bacterium]